jgi:methylenetetrahydrofolate reductase (NADPH)
LVDRIHRECDLEVMCHLTVVGQSKGEARAILDKLSQRGIENLLALGGDPPQGASEWQPHPDGFHHAVELVREAKERGGFAVAVAGFPEVHPRALSRGSDMRYLKEKVDAGATAVITQLFFDNEDYYRFVEDARKLGIEIPIVPGILPILSAPQVRRFVSLCGSKIPAKLESQLSKVEDDDVAALEMGIEYASRQCEDLMRFKVPGFHFYSLNKSRSVARVCENIGLCDQSTSW